MLIYILDGVAIVSFILFIILLIGRAHQIRHTNRRGNAGGLTVFFSWLLIILFFVSLSGIAYGTAHPEGLNQIQAKTFGHVEKHRQSSSKQSASSSSASAASRKSSSIKASESSSREAAKKAKAKQQATQASNDQKQNEGVTWDPQTPTIQNGTTNVNFVVPKNTSVVIQGHIKHQNYWQVPAANYQQRLSIPFHHAGTYDVVINRNGNVQTSTLQVN